MGRSHQSPYEQSSLLSYAEWKSKLSAMPKIPSCDRCLYYSHNCHLICVPHPSGPDGDICLDFRLDPEYSCQRFEDFLGLQPRRGEDSDEPFHNPCGTNSNEQLWEPAGASYYAGELIVQPRQRWTREEQLELLDSHPMFTGRCPQCGSEIERDYRAVVHWDCSCGWMDDTV